MSKDELPVSTRHQIEQLPRWARVAFAARCVRRAQSALLVSYRPEYFRRSFDEIDQGIRIAETAAANGTLLKRNPAEAMSIAKAAFSSNQDTLGHVARAAYHLIRSMTKEESAGRTEKAIGASLQAIQSASSIDTKRAASAIENAFHHDLAYITKLTSSRDYTDTTAVPPEVFGPMWPEGTPDGWPKEQTKKPSYIKLELGVPASLDEQETSDFNHRVAAFLAELSGLHASMGGTGLRIVDDTSTEPVLIEEPTPEWTRVQNTPVHVCVGGAS